ncbi:MAG: DUF2804 domain-containing protein [Agathobacter sp.]|nr:DUF2804 domain-containing protein [Agathobacter sp.]MBQ7065228.1 DUF2804 domain-containing protein [Lachnospiraceae bacterium]
MDYEITSKTELLSPTGQLNVKGYAKKMNFIYNRICAKSFPFKLKEWDFYQFQFDHYVLQLTLGHLSYVGQVAITLIDLNTGEKWEYGLMKPFFIPELDINPENQSFCEYHGKHCDLIFKITPKERILEFEGSNKKYKNIKVAVSIKNDVNNEKLVIATPFEKPNQFYLNYKENYYNVTGFACFDEKEVYFKDGVGLLDWGRGVWPYSHEWYWGNLTSHIDGVPFGFNIGWGFGDTSHATENIFFYNKKGYKLGTIIAEWDQNDLMKTQHIYDTEGIFDCTFVPFFNNHTENKFVVVDTECNQVFGRFSGWIETEDGRKEFKDVIAFLEHAVNKW